MSNRAFKLNQFTKAGFAEDESQSPDRQHLAGQAQAKLYARQRYVLALCSLLVGLGYLLAMVFFGSRLLKLGIERCGANQWVQVLLYTLTFLLMYDILALPVAFYNGYLSEHRFGLSTESAGAWLKDHLKTLTLSLLLVIPIVEAIYFFLRHFPSYWWFFGALVWILIAVLLARWAPVVILPLFYKLTPVETLEIRPRLERLAKDAGLDIRGVYRFNLSRTTRKATAALVGWGKSRRVLLADTLLDSFSPEEIESVFAHELGHYVRGHVPRMLAWSSTGAVLGFFFCKLVMDHATEILYRAGMLPSAQLYDIATLPVLGLVFFIFALVMLPLQNAYSRKLERESDLYALTKTRNYRAFMTALSKLAARNLLQRTPSRLTEILFYTHPPVEKRIKLAYRLMRANASVQGPSEDHSSG